MTSNRTMRIHAGFTGIWCLLIATLMEPHHVKAAAIDLSSVPLVTSSTSSVLPNLMFILDDSGSMGWAYMPDDANDFNGKYGYASPQCNGVYYDPEVRYEPPVTSTGTSFSNANFTAALSNGFDSASTTVDLSASFRPSSSYTAGAAFYYSYSGTQTTEALRNYLSTSSTFYKECNSAIGSAPGSGVFTKVTISPATTSYPKATTRTDCAGATCTYAEENQNFANWYSYYRTRMLMMKTASGRAFKAIDDKYRVGFMTINNNVSPDFLNFAPFDATQKASWYAKLYSATPNNSTPLREALSNAGRIFSGKKTSIYGTTVTDPVQYSCQQNFSILTTDGYWNGNAGFKLDGSTAVGNQDGSEPRPYNDGGNTTFSKTTTQLTQSETSVSMTTSQLQSRTTQTQQRTQQLQQQSGTATQKVTAQLFRRQSSDSGATWGDWTSRSTCTEDSSGPTRTECIVGGLEKRTSSDSGATWSSWSSVTSCSTDNSGSNRTQCQIVRNWVTAASCTPTRTGAAGSYSWTGDASAVDCQTGAAWTNVSTCTGTCQTTDTGWVNVSACTPSGPVNGQTVTCQTTDTGWVGVGSCAASGPTNGLTVSCQTAVTGPTPVATCTTQTANVSNNWTQTSCSTTTISGPTPVASCTPVAATAATGWVGTVCNTVTTGPTSVSACVAASASAANSYTATTCSAPTSSGGTSDTLADVAEYYYVTDLRTSALGNATGVLGSDVATNNVPASGLDSASWQHMTTFTLGLGARGRMIYDANYISQTSGDFFSVKNGTLANPSAGVCSWQTSGACNWPVPTGGPENIDDLWHAAVNGRGTYFSATNPASLATSLSSALAGVSARTGSSAAATTSNPNVTSGDNFVFSSTFTTQEWTGELVRQQLDLTTGVVSSTVDWNAQAKLDARTSRTIYFYSAGATNKLKTFTYANLVADGKTAYFSTPHISTSPPSGTGLTQFLCASPSICLSAADQLLAQGANLVAFLAGDRAHEGVSTDNSKYYRQRVHVLGDIVNAEAVYVKGSLQNYADTGYSAFASSIATRQGMVYAASNDGMLHAFYSADGASGIVGGDEAWAFVPSLILGNLYKLADKEYATKHQYFVDGTPVVGDIYDSSAGAWKTILVGGLNGGGRGYFALDITNPASPKALWEFSNDNLGYSYGNPKITKLKNGTWVVLFTSGYNNVAGMPSGSNGDGIGRLFVVNAVDGSLIREISTGVGSTATPSGLSKIAVKVVNPSTDNTAEQVYGGDMLGNLWRFDVNGDVGAPGYDAQLLAALQNSSGGIQPITTKPEVGIVSGNVMVYVGTGRYLGATDMADTTQQTFYGIKDPLSTTTTPSVAIYNNPRSGNNFVQQVQTTTVCPTGSSSSICTTGQVVRTSTRNAVDLSSNNGWYIDLPDSGERANTDPMLALGTLGFTTNVPNSSACNVGGYSYRYFVDYRTGAPVSTSSTDVASAKLGNAIATRPVFVRLPNNTIVELTRTSDGSTVTSNVPIGASGMATRRTSWRELISE